MSNGNGWLDRRNIGRAGKSQSRRPASAALFVLATAGAVVVSVPGSAEAAPVHCYGKVATIVGTNGPDRLVGTPGPDVIAGMGGNDRIYGGGGADTLCGKDGNDTIWGDKGGLRLPGVAAGDHIAGNNGHDTIFGEAGHDALRGFFGRDTLFGGPGRDDLEGGDGFNYTINWGDDTLVGGRDEDRLDGSAGKDRLFVGADNQRRDWLAGHRGDDLLDARDGARNDVVRGGTGVDTCLRDRGEPASGCERG